MNINSDKNFFYDDFSDSLMISNPNNKDEIIGSVRILNLIIDFATNSRIANVEIKNVSELLKQLDINPSILENLKAAKINLKQLRNGYLIYFILKYDDKVERIPYNIQTKEQIILA